MTSTENRLAVVTGASRGIGRATALTLADRGYDIVALASNKSQALLEELDDEIRAKGRSATLVPFDLKEGDAIDRLGAALFERFGKIDALVANAAILGPLTPLAQMTVKDFEKVMTINVKSVWRLLRSMHPLLQQSEAPRAVVVSSAAARKSKPFWGGYALSKAAVERMVMTYAAEVDISNIKINLVDPGPTRTNMRSEAVPGEDPDTLPDPSEVAGLIADMLDPTEQRSGELVAYYDVAGLSR